MGDGYDMRGKNALMVLLLMSVFLIVHFDVLQLPYLLCFVICVLQNMERGKKERDDGLVTLVGIVPLFLPAS